MTGAMIARSCSRWDINFASMNRRSIIFYLALGAALQLVVACSSSSSVTKQRTVDDVFGEAMKAYDNGEWLDAQSKFEVVKLQYPASQFADDAQYYLAEINFERGEYIMAAFNYNLVRRSYPSSEFVQRAMFKTGLCYDKISLPADRDQENTLKAIQAYTEFQTMYGRDSLAREASVRIHDLRNRLAERYWLITEHYMNTTIRRAAIIHLDAIIDEFADTKWLEPALVLKLRILIDQEKIDDARAVLATYRRLVRDPQQSAEVSTLEKELP